MFFALLSVTTQDIDPHRLALLTEHTVEARLNTAVSTNSGDRATLEDIVQAAEGKRFVYVGENHDSADAHRWQTLVIGALHDAGRRVIVGFEMLQRQQQVHLDKWTLGRYDEQQFLDAVDWQTTWGFDFELYRPIFYFAQTRGLRTVALNVPRDWVRTAAREGYEALPEDAKRQLPEMFLGNQSHRAVFEALMQGHPPGAALEGTYRGQVLWDEGMADAALRYLDRTSVSDKTVFVVIAGNGHVMYDQGINYRVHRRSGLEGITIVTVGIHEKQVRKIVSSDLGDYVIGIRLAESD